MREARFQLAQRLRPPTENIWSAFGGALKNVISRCCQKFIDLWMKLRQIAYLICILYADT